MKNRREKKACRNRDYTKASWYYAQHCYRAGKRAMNCRHPVNFTVKHTYV